MFDPSLDFNSFLSSSANPYTLDSVGSTTSTAVDLITPDAVLQSIYPTGSDLSVMDVAVDSFAVESAVTATAQATNVNADSDSLTGQALAQIGVTQLNALSFDANALGDPNDEFSEAIDLGILSTSLNSSEIIGYNESYGRDDLDRWKFNVSTPAKVSLSLTALSGDAGLAIYNSAEELLTWSNQGGNSNESISRWLGTGTYYALVYSQGEWGGSTSYNIGIEAGASLDSLIQDYSVYDAVSSQISDGIIDRNDMISIIRSTKDYGSADYWEVGDLREIVNDANAFGLANYVQNLANKVVNSDMANTTSGIGNLAIGSSDSQIESLVGKWFLGNDRPDIGSDYSYQYASGSLFQNGISYTDIQQGNLANCYFVASLGTAAHQKQSYIQDMFIDNEDGTFTVQFFKDGASDYITVDRYLPTTADDYAAYAGWGGGIYNESDNELWVALAEKAYAQLNESSWIGQDNTNSYSGIEYGGPGAVMNHITGLETSSGNITINDIVNAYNSGKMVAINTNPGDGKKTFLDPDEQVVANHSYVMTGYDSVTQQFELYNPWGNTVYLSHSQIGQYFQGWDYTTT
jgi:hypothetical protein